MRTVPYGSKAYWDAVRRCDVHEYVDSCGRGWLVANDYSIRARMPE